MVTSFLIHNAPLDFQKDVHYNKTSNMNSFDSNSVMTCGHCGKELPIGLDYFRVTKVYPICRECGGHETEILAQSETRTAAIDWRPYEELVITPERENWELLLLVEQIKLCYLKVPRVITADIIDGKVRVCYSHRLTEKDWTLSKITHYTWLTNPD